METPFASLVSLACNEDREDAFWEADDDNETALAASLQEEYTRKLRELQCYKRTMDLQMQVDKAERALKTLQALFRQAKREEAQAREAVVEAQKKRKLVQKNESREETERRGGAMRFVEEPAPFNAETRPRKRRACSRCRKFGHNIVTCTEETFFVK